MQTQREFALFVVKKLRSAGYQALWAGGCVRDQLLGITPKDYDIATSALPEEVRKVFGKKETLPLGAAFGVITILPPKSSPKGTINLIEVATFRTDGGYSDGRRPDTISFCNAEEDAKRRDFTINGIFYDPIAEKVLDYVGGQEDLAAQKIRAIGNPKERFAEDKLRIMRAIRFTTRFDFELDPKTYNAIETFVPDLLCVSFERITAELREMFLHSNRAKAVSYLRKTKILPLLFPHLAEVTEETWQQIVMVLKRLENPTFPLVLATLLRPLFEECFCQVVQQQERTPQRLDKILHNEQHKGRNPLINCKSEITTFCKKLKLSNAETQSTWYFLRSLPFVFAANKLDWPYFQPILLSKDANHLLQYSQLIATIEGKSARGAIEGINFCEGKLTQPAGVLDPPPLLVGADLIRLGLRPGPNFKHLLWQVRYRQLLHEITTADQAIEYVKHIISN